MQRLHFCTFLDPTNTTCAGAFCIDHETGVLSLLEMLDTETQPMHTVTLAISNLRELEYDVRAEKKLCMQIIIFYFLHRAQQESSEVCVLLYHRLCST